MSCFIFKSVVLFLYQNARALTLKQSKWFKIKVNVSALKLKKSDRTCLTPTGDTF